jgi:hypothetical protein
VRPGDRGARLFRRVRSSHAPEPHEARTAGGRTAAGEIPARRESQAGQPGGHEMRNISRPRPRHGQASLASQSLELHLASRLRPSAPRVDGIISSWLQGQDRRTTSAAAGSLDWNHFKVAKASRRASAKGACPVVRLPIRLLSGTLDRWHGGECFASKTVPFDGPRFGPRRICRSPRVEG